MKDCKANSTTEWVSGREGGLFVELTGLGNWSRRRGGE